MRSILSAACLLIGLLFTSFSAGATSWNVFVYMCGSDLESNYGAAISDIQEMLDADPSDEITIILQTGGSEEWHDFDISAQNISRYMIKNGEMTLLDQLPQANMGDGQTLADFLHFCKENFHADKQVLLFWDHGGGSVDGFANDQNYDFDSILLSEFRDALSSVYGDTPDSRPFELIGFDTCLMATIDTAAYTMPYSRYFVASQEVEPGNGWQYTLWLSALAGDTNMDGAELGKHMCDAYYQGCIDAETNEMATLACIDLDKIEPLINAWNTFGMYTLMQASEDDSFYADIGRAANSSENFSNSKSSGYTNMVDMGDFIGKVSSTQQHPAADEMQKLLKKAVIYQVSGPAHHASGLSCYYPLDSEEDNYKKMMENGLINSFMLTYGLQHGFLDNETASSMAQDIASFESEEAASGGDGHEQATASNEDQDEEAEGGEHEQATASNGEQGHGEEASSSGSGGVNAIANAVNQSVDATLQSLLEQKPDEHEDPIAFIQNMVSSNVNTILASIKPMQKVDISSLEDKKVDLVNLEDGKEAFQITIDKPALKYIDSVRFYLASIEENGDVYFLGDDINMNQDWDEGVFQDNFNGSWPTIDGHYVFLETTADLEDYNYYSIPVILNGVKSAIEALFDFKKQQYLVLGARRITENGVPDKHITKLKPGDKITPILQKVVDKEGNLAEVEGESFALSDKWTMEDSPLPDGGYGYIFSMSDIQGNSAMSKVSYIEVKDGEFKRTLDEE